MKIRTFAIAAVFASLLGTAAVNAETTTTDADSLNGYSTMTYNNIYLAQGEEAAVAVKPLGNTYMHVSVYDYNNYLIADSTCRAQACVVRWYAKWNATFHVRVENLGAYPTQYGFALAR
jgi:hypothetical protein